MPNDLLVNREQSRELDRRAIEEYGITGLVLMENAGRGTVDVLERLGISGPVVIFCGKGNNAGDGFVMARHLEIRGYECRVILLFPASELTGDAATNFRILQQTSVPIIETPAEFDSHCADADWTVDAMLGTGARGEPREPIASAIDWMNAQDIRKLAVDVPSGLDCETGEPAVHTVRADHTCTYAAMKIGLTKETASPFQGIVEVCDIGVPPRLVEEIARRRCV
jgi:NAD(P)H-hydrate epimerase